MNPCLTKHYKEPVKDKRSNPRKGVESTLYLGIVAFEKGALGSPSTTAANFIYIYIYIYILYIYIYIYPPLHIYKM